MFLSFKYKCLVLYFMVVLTFAGCANCLAPGGSATGLQKQSMETEYIEGDFKTIFISIRDAFMNEGYSLENSEIKSGFLSFKKPIQPNTFETCALGGGNANRELDAKLRRGIQATVLINDMGEKSEVRASFAGIDDTKVEEYAIFLKRLYADVRKQVMIRKSTK